MSITLFKLQKCLFQSQTLSDILLITISLRPLECQTFGHKINFYFISVDKGLSRNSSLECLDPTQCPFSLNSPELAAGVQPSVHNVEGVLPPPAQTQQLGSVGVHSDPLHLAIIISIIYQYHYPDNCSEQLKMI